MSDLISRHGTSAWLENMGHPNLAKMIMDEKRFPSAQPEVIHCEECKWWGDQNGSTAWLPCMIIATKKDWYCGFAERREVMEWKLRNTFTFESSP